MMNPVSAAWAQYLNNYDCVNAPDDTAMWAEPCTVEAQQLSQAWLDGWAAAKAYFSN